MAISQVHFDLLCQLNRRGLLPDCPRLLEIGQATYYGDMDPIRIIEAAEEFKSPALPGIKSRVTKIIKTKQLQNHLLELARLIYQAVVMPYWITSIDPSGDEEAINHDLNLPLDLGSKFDLIINHGTAEHIFNISNVFRVMHDHAAVGAVMIHESPFTGWIDHGFYSLQPTLFYDVASANNYQIDLLAAEDLKTFESFRIESREHACRLNRQGAFNRSLTLFCAYKKLFDNPFRIPMQGVYTNAVSAEVKNAWKELR